MYQEGEAILSLLNKKGYDAYYIGGKCRNELHNINHPSKKVEIKDIDIITNAKPEEISNIFTRSKLRGESFQVVAVNFGGYEFEIATYRKDIYDKEKIKNSKKIVNPETIIAKSLDEDRERRDFTINAIAQDLEGNYIDYSYKYRNKKISAIHDIEQQIIRVIGNARQRFEEDPLRILRAFRFMAQLGYEIESQTLKAIQSNLELIEKIPHERISLEMNKLILGKYADSALQLMKEIGMFDITVYNSIRKENISFLKELKLIGEFSVLDKLNSKSNPNITEIEAWTVLLKPLGEEIAKKVLLDLQALNNDGIEKVSWLIKYFDLIEADDLKNAIYNARTGIVKRLKLMCMKELVDRLYNIHYTLKGKEYKSICDNLLYTFRFRPYFEEQLKITGEDLIEIAGEEEPGPWINLAKEKLIYKLVNAEKFPKDMEIYLELASEAVEEAFAEELMKEEGLIF